MSPRGTGRVTQLRAEPGHVRSDPACSQWSADVPEDRGRPCLVCVPHPAPARVVAGTLRPWHLTQVGSAEPHPLVVDAYLLGWRHGVESAPTIPESVDLTPAELANAAADVAVYMATDPTDRRRIAQLLQLRSHQVMRGIVRTLGQDPNR